MFTGVAMETRRAGAESVDVVARTAVNAGAGLVAAVAVETGEALSAAVLSSPSSITDAAVGGADAVDAAGWRLTHQRVTGISLPALLTPTASVHTVAVSAAVRWLTTPRVDAQDGGDTAGAAPPAV